MGTSGIEGRAGRRIRFERLSERGRNEEDRERESGSEQEDEEILILQDSVVTVGESWEKGGRAGDVRRQAETRSETKHRTAPTLLQQEIGATSEPDRSIGQILRRIP